MNRFPWSCMRAPGTAPPTESRDPIHSVVTPAPKPTKFGTMSTERPVARSGDAKRMNVAAARKQASDLVLRASITSLSSRRVFRAHSVQQDRPVPYQAGRLDRIQIDVADTDGDRTAAFETIICTQSPPSRAWRRCWQHL